VYLAAAIVDNLAAVIDHKLSWAAVESLDEARYLVAVLNSGALLRIVQPLQARGEHNPPRLRQIRLASTYPAVQRGEPAPPRPR